MAHNLLCKCNIENKRERNDRFKEAQHSFGVAVKEAKRQYWHDQQDIYSPLIKIVNSGERWTSLE